MTSQQEADALLHAFWREREQKSREPGNKWGALMPPKAPGIVPEQKRHTAQGNHSDRAVRYETETAYEGVM